MCDKKSSNKCGDCFYCYKIYGLIWCAKSIKRTDTDNVACSDFRKPLHR